MNRSLRASVSLWLVIASTASAQTSRIEGGSTTLGGVVFYYETRLQPPVPPLGDSLSMLIITSQPDTVHRVMLDHARKVYFGYDAHISDGGRVDQGVYRVAFGPLTVTPQITRALGDDPAAWKLLPAPRFPPARTIRPDEVIELELLRNETWGQRLIEYVTVGQAPRQGFNAERPREFAFAAGNPRDFTAADVVLTLTEPRVTWTSPDGIERKTVGDVTGAVVWVYVPNAGRILLSLVPRRQFVRGGSVRGTSLTFQVDGNTYNINSATRIVPGDAAFNVYVLRQPNWKPSFAHANLDTIHIGAAERAEYLIQ